MDRPSKRRLQEIRENQIDGEYRGWPAVGDLLAELDAVTAKCDDLRTALIQSRKNHQAAADDRETYRKQADEWEAIAVNLSRRLPNDGNGAAWWIIWARAEIKKEGISERL